MLRSMASGHSFLRGKSLLAPTCFQSCRPNSLQRISIAAYTHGSKKKREKTNVPLLLSVQIDSDLSKHLQVPSGSQLRKGKIKVSSSATISLDLLKKKLENHFPGLASAQYKIRYKIGEKMKLPRRCTSDEEAREALQECALQQCPLHLSLHPDYYSSPSSSSPSSSTSSKSKSQSNCGESLHTSSSSLSPFLPEYMRDMPNPDLTPSFTLVSFYRFKAVPQPDATVARMRELWQPFKVYGRVYVAEEGVNAQMAVPTNVLRQFETASSLLDVLQEDQDEHEDSVEAQRGSGGFQVNCDSREMTVEEFHMHAPFRALHIRRRRQVLVDGFEEPLDWRTGSGGDQELTPWDWHRRIPSPSSSSSSSSSPSSSTVQKDSEGSPGLSPIILDCRNKYESAVGRFEGAIPLDTHTFKDSWAALSSLLQDKDPETPIMTYCTGGIRCVKINAYLTQKMGFKNTSRLKGGIIAYARQRKEWQDAAEARAEAEAEAETEVTRQQHVDATSRTTTDDDTVGVSSDIDMLASKFKGVNYVFDERMGERITDDVLSQCQCCGAPHDMFVNCKHCSVRFLQCKSCAFDLSSCCSSTCKAHYLTDLEEKETLLSKKHANAKLLQQAKQHKKSKKKRNGSKSFAKSESPRTSPDSRAGQQRRSYSSSSSHLSVLDSSGAALQDGSALLSYCEMFSTPEPPLLTKLRHETRELCSPASQRMLCDPLQGRLLSLLSLLHRPYAVLELGTFTGYSALCLAEGLERRQGCTSSPPPFLLTVDSDIVTTRIAKKYLQQYLTARNEEGADPCQHIHMESLDGKGAEVLQNLHDQTEHMFDLVFLDANKKGYIDYLKVLMGEGGEEEREEGVAVAARACDRRRAMLSPNALIVVDNTLWKGMVVQEVPALAALAQQQQQLGGGEGGGGGGRMQQLAKALHAFNSHCREHPLLSPVLLPIRDGLTVVRYNPPPLSS